MPNIPVYGPRKSLTLHRAFARGNTYHWVPWWHVRACVQHLLEKEAADVVAYEGPLVHSIWEYLAHPITSEPMEHEVMVSKCLLECHWCSTYWRKQILILILVPWLPSNYSKHSQYNRQIQNKSLEGTKSEHLCSICWVNEVTLVSLCTLKVTTGTVQAFLSAHSTLNILHLFWRIHIALSLIKTQLILVARNTLLPSVFSPWHSEATLNSGSWLGKFWTCYELYPAEHRLEKDTCISAYIQVNVPLWSTGHLTRTDCLVLFTLLLEVCSWEAHIAGLQSLLSVPQSKVPSHAPLHMVSGWNNCPSREPQLHIPKMVLSSALQRP